MLPSILHSGFIVVAVMVIALPARAQAAGDEERPVRGAESWSVTYHSHLLLISGLRIAYRLDPDYEVSGLVGQAVLTGCGVQAPECIQAPALNAGIRRYLTTGTWAPYAGLNIHYLTEGLRFSDHALLSDVNVGIQAESEGGFIFGAGLNLLSYPTEERVLGHATWFHSEIGCSF